MNQVVVEREEHGKDANAEFQTRVEEQGSRQSIHHRTQPGIAQRETAHEGGQHRNHRVAGVSQEKRQIPGPHDLIHQAGDTRDEEGGQNKRE